MGMKKFSVSFRLAEKKDVRNVGVIAHNNRKFFAKNVDQNRSEDNITFKSIDLREFYHQLFDEALEKYNERKRSNEKIHDYYEHIKNSKQESLFEEIIVEFGNMNDSPIGSDEWEVKKQLCEDYMREFEKRNPNMKVFNAVLHLDEANPHLHIDFVPIATNQTRGLSTRVSMKQALIEQGFVPQGRMENGKALWGNHERDEVMPEILHRHNLERDVKNIHRAHLTIAEFKAQCAEFEKERVKAEKIKSNLEILSQKGEDEYSAEEIALIKNQNNLMKNKIEQQREQISALVHRYNSPIKKFEVYDPDKLLYVARGLENLKIQFAEENSAIYVPEFALVQCKKLAADYKKMFPGIKEKIRMDIDVLVLSSESLEQLLDKLQALGYEIKRGKYLAVKSPDAERFTRLKSLGEKYLPENLEQRIAEREKFPAAVRAELENTSGIVREFHMEISKTIYAVQGLSYRPSKSREQEIYSFGNDNIIDDLSKQILTIVEFDINSREKLYATAEELEKTIAEKASRVDELTNEIPTLKEKIENGDNSEELRRRYELLPDYIESLKSEIERDRLKLSRVSDVIKNYEKISGGDYIGNIIREQQAQAAREQQDQIVSREQQIQNTRVEVNDAPKKS